MIAEATRQTGQSLQSDGELVTVHSLLQAARAAGIRADRQAIVNTYVSLKSRPFLILTGEKQTGKIEMVKRLGRVLTDIPARQCHFFVAHARWAAQSQNVARFVEMQARFNRSNLLAVIEEALQPENVNRLFIVCLSRISPVELHDYFPVAGFQFWPDQMRRTDDPTVAPIPYPPNFRLVGTMDVARFTWWEADLLRRTTVVQWPGERMGENAGIVGETAVHRPPAQRFLQSCVHSEQRAYTRLRRLLQGQRQAFRPLMQVLAILENADVTLPREVIQRVVIYLANAWSEEGRGLFAPSRRRNLNLALDMALVQYVLPWVVAIQPAPERSLSRLAQLFYERFEQASTFVPVVPGKALRPMGHQPNYL